MSTKNNPGDFDCYANAAPDEPMFILLARDRDAALLVRMWALMREMAVEMGAKPVEDRRQVAEARQCAYEMDRYRQRIAGLISKEQYLIGLRQRDLEAQIPQSGYRPGTGSPPPAGESWGEQHGCPNCDTPIGCTASQQCLRALAEVVRVVSP